MQCLGSPSGEGPQPTPSQAGSCPPLYPTPCPFPHRPLPLPRCAACCVRAWGPPVSAGHPPVRWCLAVWVPFGMFPHVQPHGLCCAPTPAAAVRRHWVAACRVRRVYGICLHSPGCVPTEGLRVSSSPGPLCPEGLWSPHAGEGLDFSAPWWSRSKRACRLEGLEPASGISPKPLRVQLSGPGFPHLWSTDMCVATCSLQVPV